MSRLTEAEILRLNCPGFGQQSFLTQGCARPLHEYRAVVINPVSIIHLFDKDPELILEVEAHSLDGMTSYQAKSDKVLDSIMLDLEMRMVELVQLIEDGGLVVYFLCPPFELRDASNTIDNYYWLGEFAPDKPAGRGDRNMSAAARGRVKEVTEAGTESEFASYFNQSGLQWTTIIRRENLTEGYSMLATAGPNKCVAGQMETGRNKGRLVFLPAPYSAEYDRRLVECLNLWLSVRSEPVAVASTSPLSDDSQTVPVAEEPVEETTSQEQPAAVTGESEPGETAGDSDSATLVEASSQLEVSPESLDTDLHPKAEGELVDSEAERKADDGAFNGSSQPKAEELMSKIGKISRSATPDWCQSFSFDYLDRRRSELSGLEETLRATEEMIKQTKDKISTMWSLKNALLWAEGDELIHAVSHVLERLGWQVKLANSDRCELWLTHAGVHQAITKVVRCREQGKRSDIACLAESVITHWGEHEVEPKGILIASTWADQPPAERIEEDFSNPLANFAEKKHLCLITSLQLLCIYHDLVCGQGDPVDIRETILSVNGQLPGFVLSERSLDTARA